MASRPVLHEIRTEHDALEALSASRRGPVLIYKHSPVCGLSDLAETQVLRYVEGEARDIRFYRVDVIESRPASQRLADLLEVRHESPQVLLVREGRCAWHGSHRAITADRLRDGVDQVLSA